MLRKKRSLRSSRTAQERKLARKVRVGLLLGIVISLYAILALVSFVPEFSIAKIAVRGNALVGTGELESRIEATLQERYLGTISKRNIFLYPRRSLEKEVLSTHSEISSVELSRTGLTSIALSVNEYKPFALWCGDIPEGGIEEISRGSNLGSSDSSPAKECYFISEGGVIFIQAPHFDEGVFLEITGPVLGGAVRDGVEYKNPLGLMLIENGFSEIGALLGVFNAREYDVTQVVYNNDRDVAFVLGNGARIFFTLNQTVETILDNLETVLGAGELAADELTESSSSLDYVDLRFKGRVFIK